MPPKLKVDVKKLEAERLSGFLQEMLREEENKYCADCEAKQPRWASWNLGVFLCIRCAGLHRNLGVHISKVKSVNLDSWTPEQVQSMRVMGNAKAKAVYEAELPHLFRRPQSDQSLEAFIRAKYESKRYIMKDWQPPPVNVSDLPLQAGLEKKITEKGDKKSSIPAVASPKSIGGQISPTQTINPLQSPMNPPTEEPVLVDLFDLNAPAPAAISTDLNSTNKSNDNIDDIFGPIVSANAALGTVNQPTDVQLTFAEPHVSDFNLDGISFSEASQSQPATQTDGKKSNSDILALFGPNRPTAPQSQSMPSFYAPTNSAVPINAIPPFAANLMSPNLMGIHPTSLQTTTSTTTASSNAKNTSGLDDLLGNFKL